MPSLIPEPTLLFNLDSIVSNQIGTATARLLADASTNIDQEGDPTQYNESSFEGYARINLDSWTSAAIVNGAYAQKTHPRITFSFTGVSGEATVYGLIVVNQSGDKVMFGQYFNTPIVLTTAKRDLPIDLILQLLT